MKFHLAGSLIAVLISVCVNAALPPGGVIPKSTPPAAQAPAPPPPPQSQAQKDRSELDAVVKEEEKINKQLEGLPLFQERKRLDRKINAILDRIHPPEKPSPLKPVAPAMSIPHKVIIAGFEVMTAPCECQDSHVRRKGLTLMADFVPPIQANERYLLNIEPDGNKQTAFRGMAYGDCKDMMKLKGTANCCQDLEIITKNGKRYAVIDREYPVKSTGWTFFKRKEVKTGPTLNSLVIDGKNIPIPAEKP